MFDVNKFAFNKSQKFKYPHCIKCIAASGLKTHIKKICPDKACDVFTY